MLDEKSGTTHMAHYLDGLLLAEYCRLSNHFGSFGPWNKKKKQPLSLTFLGIELDTVEMVLWLPQRKLQHLQSLPIIKLLAS